MRQQVGLLIACRLPSVQGCGVESLPSELEPTFSQPGCRWVGRFWDQLNADVEFLCKRLVGFRAETATAGSEKRLPDPFLHQLVSGHAKAVKEVENREEELFEDASDVEKALAQRSQRLQQSLAHLVERMSHSEHFHKSQEEQQTNWFLVSN